MEKINEIDEKYLKENAANVTDADIGKVAEKADEIQAKFKKGGPLGRFVEDGKLLISLVKDYWKGNYRTIPYWAIGAIVFALLYVLSPIDLIPDVIPVIGLLDDAAVLGLCLGLVEQELEDYREWKKLRSEK